MDKSKIKNFAINARRELIGSVSQRLAQLGITTSEISQEMPASTPELKYYTKEQIVSNNGLTGQQITWRSNIVNELKTRGYYEDQQTVLEDFIEEVAYTWFNQIIAIRFMEVNNYLPTRVRVLSSESGNSEPDIIDEALNLRDDLGNFTPEEDQLIGDAQLSLDPRKLDQAYEILFIKQCDALAEILPGLFEKTKDYLKLLFTPNYNHGVIQELVTEIPESYFDVQDEGQVQIIGWLYQYYNTEPKDAAFKKRNYSTSDIPAVTQLFTPDWIVKYMVENSLGRYWIDILKARGDQRTEKEIAQDFNWQYYMPSYEKNSQISKEELANKDVQDITFIDPAMGSGHILVYAFDILGQIYESEGYSKRQAAVSILNNNLFGLDIDTRAYQLSYFALLMKAREYDRRLFRRDLKPHIYDIPVTDLKAADFDIAIEQSQLDQKKVKQDLASLLALFKNGNDLGSIIQTNALDLASLSELIKSDRDSSENESQYEQLSFMDDERDNQQELAYLLEIAQVLNSTYDIGVTNPPYMGGGKMDPALKKYVQKHYPDSKADMFGVFIEVMLNLTKKTGYVGMITQHSWMFLSNFEKLRKKLQDVTIVNLAHLGTRAFEEIGGEVVQTVSFILQKGKTNGYQGTYERLVDYNSQDTKEKAYLSIVNGEDTKDLYHANQANFNKIPGSLVSYWASKKGINNFLNKKLLDYGNAVNGFTTGNNNLFLRMWFEVSNNNISYTELSRTTAINSKKKWFPYNKGGVYRKWYGNNDYVINWYNDGQDIREYGHLVPRSLKYMFKQSISWSKVSSGSPSFRSKLPGTMFDVAGLSLFLDDEYNYNYILALLNSTVSVYFLGILSPTINYETGQVSSVPVIIKNEDNISSISQQNISLSKSDWDAFETSWDFQRSPLLTHTAEHNHNWLLSEAFTTWQTEAQDRFNKLKSNEEELNRIFINLYGLQDELTPEEEDKDVSVRLADRERDIKDFLSYFIGCIFGRYSLDTDGLAYAGGNWDTDKYVSFKPNKNNLLMLTDTQYFDDERDVIVRLREFLTKTFGADTVNDNLNFIAESLDANKYAKGTDSETIIRDYFINDFFKDHDKKYSKRPIYWEFNSGHSKGFKALMYLHRYDTGELAMVRQNMHTLQAAMNNRLSVTQRLLDAETVSKNKTLDRRIIANLKKQIDEIVKYDQILGSLSANPVDLDLDDGVLVNHAKLQNGYKLLSKL
ncbi:BREX-1 system adenine-specific DNA-methyltransferase PglX [Limosilactobacillus mucosae]|uniref:BREX-1 system adenine-specific DNA-methyltransferase PglX n=1 Tax=Limosilactobacillus mucosae TaxID=97478 RepID=UPI000652829C|nr:BREX-1 system adenine-specific DNA-methyltransferase PglX [Limosilactobacillus mucosae]